MSSATTTTTTNVIDLDANLQQRRPNLNEQDNNNTQPIDIIKSSSS